MKLYFLIIIIKFRPELDREMLRRLGQREPNSATSTTRTLLVYLQVKNTIHETYNDRIKIFKKKILPESL